MANGLHWNNQDHRETFYIVENRESEDLKFWGIPARAEKSGKLWGSCGGWKRRPISKNFFAILFFRAVEREKQQKHLIYKK